MTVSNPRIEAIVTAIGHELSAGIFAAQTRSAQLDRIVSPDEAEAERRSALGRRWLAALSGIDRAGLDDEDALNLAIADATALRLAREADWYWRVHDPLGMGFFGRFSPTAYAGGWHLSLIGGEMQRQNVDTPADQDRYLGLVEDIVRVVKAMATRLAGQRVRGLAMPQVQAENARRLIAATKSRLADQLRAGPRRDCQKVASQSFSINLENLLNSALEPAFKMLADEVDAASGRSEAVLGATAQGRQIYHDLVAHYLSLPIDAEAAHALGLEKMARIAAEMAQARSDAAFSGDDHAYASALETDPVWSASSVEAMTFRFAECLKQAQQNSERWFRVRPATSCEAAPLPAALEASMTFGYYQIGRPGGEPSRYLFNAQALRATGLARVPAFAFHELEPGHHIHLATQAENDRLPALRRYNSFNAFNEGWAEYAATLAGESGLYRTPAERFGRLMLEAMLTSRLVVDTGLNARGWTLDTAANYLTEQGFLPLAVARSEAVRYAHDLPGQALAYKLGDDFLLQQRERMRNALGPRFDLRDFHALVLEPGARPLPLVARAVDKAITSA